MMEETMTTQTQKFDDLLCGEIYAIKNKINNKYYIGQARKYLSNGTKWGSYKRFLSHLKEAENPEKDHCTALNNAIRKYGSDAFKLEILEDNIKLEELDEAEKFYIEHFDSNIPNGYNITIGGSQPKLTDKVKIHMRNNKTKQTIVRHNDEDKDIPLYIKPKRIRGRIFGYLVYFPIPNSLDYDEKMFAISKEDVYDAPPELVELHLDYAKAYVKYLNKKYNVSDIDVKVMVKEKKDEYEELKEIIQKAKISQQLRKITIDDIIYKLKSKTINIGYKVKYTPLNICREFVKKDVDKSLIEAEQFASKIVKVVSEHNEYIENLTKKKFIEIDKDDNSDKTEEDEEEKPLIKTDSKYNKFLESKKKKKLEELPEYIYPIYNKTQLVGYYVDKYPKHDGDFYPKADFTDLSSNVRNLEAAKRHIRSLEIENKNAQFNEFVPDDLKNIGVCKRNEKRSNSTLSIPKYVALVIINGKKIGYQINNLPHNGKLYKKKFCDTKITLEENYNLTLDYMRSILKNEEHENNDI